MLQGSLDMNGVLVELNSTGRPTMEWELTIVQSTACTSLNVAVQSKDVVCNYNEYIEYCEY